MKKHNENHGENHGNDGSMTVVSHLKEMRNRIAVCVVFLVLAMFAGLYFAEDIVENLMAMGEKYNYHFVYIAPQELLLVYFLVSFIFAIVVTLPIILYEIWAFITPGMMFKSKLLIITVLIFGMICAFIGIAFAKEIMLPYMLRFLHVIGEGSNIDADISVDNYISFLATIFIIFAMIFELPIVSLILTQTGILKTEWLKKTRKIIIVFIFFIAAVITPPDVVSQIMTAVPMLLLFEISIFLCGLADRLRSKDKTGQKAGEIKNAG